VKLTLPYPPSANRYWRSCRGRVVPSTEAIAYKRSVGLLCRAARAPKLSGDVVVTVEVFRPARRGDLDNRLKVLLDALRGYVFDDDDQVVAIHAQRRDDKERPRVELEVVEAISP
jgi:crossover junction endodeoxyribonuclease RusA